MTLKFNHGDIAAPTPSIFSICTRVHMYMYVHVRVCRSGKHFKSMYHVSCIDRCMSTCSSYGWFILQSSCVYIRQRTIKKLSGGQTGYCEYMHQRKS